MFETQWPWIELHRAVLAHDASDVYANVLAPWAAANAEERHWLAEYVQRTDDCWPAATGNDLCRLYAAYRVTSLLLLRFQDNHTDGDYAGPAVSVDDFRCFHEAIGFRVPTVASFHPFYHEVTAVRPLPTPGDPIEGVDARWPPLMLGSMMFCRGGTLVTGGTDHVVRGVAERSKLYWAYRRNDRPCHDLSHGWGHNSQWRTAIRRDYVTSSGYHYNVDAGNGPASADDDLDGLSLEVVRELVRNRCLVRTELDDSDLFPYRHSDVEPA